MRNYLFERWKKGKNKFTHAHTFTKRHFGMLKIKSVEYQQQQK